MANDEHVAMLGRGAAVWNEWRADAQFTGLVWGRSARLDLSGFELSGADLRRADLRGTNLSRANLSGAHLDGANFFKAVLDGANIAGAFLNGAQFLNCAQLIVAQNWQTALRDEMLGCGASIPERMPSE